MVSDFRKKKMMHVFNAFFDTDRNGYVDKKDFEVAFTKIAELRGWKPSEPIYQESKKNVMAIWAGLQKEADKDNDGKVTAEEWIQLWDDFSKDPSKSSEWQSIYCKFMFQLEDVGNDGEIDGEEFSTLYAKFGLDKEECLEAFEKMAKGKKGIRWEQFQELWKEYYAAEDQSAPGNFIYGCYVCSINPGSHSHSH